MDEQTNSTPQNLGPNEITEGGEQLRKPETAQPQRPASPEENLEYRGRTVALEDMQKEQKDSTEETGGLVSLYERTIMDFKEGEIVRGKIIAIGDKEIAVDIGFKSEGTVLTEEFDDLSDLKVGDDIEVYLDRVENAEGQLILSKKKADFLKLWERIGEIYHQNETIEGKILRRIKGGMVVDILGVDAFLPGSQIDIRPVRDFDALVGETMDFRIVKLNDSRKNVVVSHKVLVEESMAGVREKVLSEMEVGKILEGTVKNITDFGVFVDLGGVDGLLHITDLSWGRVGHPSEVVQLDQKLQVKVLDYDPERRRISVGLKQLQPHPWEGVETKYPVGSRVKGRVVSIARYGAFVELEKGLEGLIHISEMSWTQHIKHPSALVSVGDEIEIVVLAIDKENRKISLGLKQTEKDPWEDLEQKYTVGSRHKGIVRDLVPFGAFVELEDGIDGLVHISDLSWTRRVRHPGEVLKKEDEVEIVVLGFDRGERRIALGLKQAQENPWDRFEQAYPIKTQTTGKVVRVLEKGVVVELPLEVEGFVPNSQLRRLGKGAERRTIKAGDELALEVIEFDKESKRIILSALEAEKTAETKAYDEYLKTSEGAAVQTPQEIPEIPTAEAAAEKATEEGAPPAAAEAPKEVADTTPQESAPEVPEDKGETPTDEPTASASAESEKPPEDTKEKQPPVASEGDAPDSPEEPPSDEPPSPDKETSA
jgi:small subunit ribosomal protein S1